MKKVILTLAVLTTLLISCNNKKTELAPANDTVKANDSMSQDSTVVDSTLLDTTKTK
jgi:uncharacterized lipoprotein NlpE involved in copper resistance